MTKSGPRSLFRTTALCSAAVFVVLPLLLVWASHRESKTEKLIKQRLAELRATGEPTTAEDLAKLFPDPQPEMDASRVFARAFLIVTNKVMPPGVPFIDSTLPNSQAIAPQVFTQLLTFCESTAAVTNVLPTELTIPVRFPSHWQLGFTNQRGGSLSFVAARSFTHAITAQIVAAAEIGDTASATRWLETGFYFARAIPYEGTLVEHMVRVAIERTLCDASERALARAQFTEDQLQRISRSIPEKRDDDFKNCLRVERCLGIWAFEATKAGFGDDVIVGRKRDPWWKRAWERIQSGTPRYRDEDYLLYLENNAAKLNLNSEPTVVVEQLTRVIQEQQSKAVSELGMSVVPYHFKAFTSQFDTRTKFVAMKAALEVERYRLAYDGALPNTRLPRDPFANQPLKLKPLPTGFMVYSVGIDCLDHGGLTRTNSNTQTNYDVVFKIERAIRRN